METPLLQTKLYKPPVAPKLVFRPRLVERLDKGLSRKLTLISAPAGFGKTTLVSSWLSTDRFSIWDAGASSISHQHSRSKGQPLIPAWLALDEADNDPTRFMSYFIAALQRLEPSIGQAAQTALQAGATQGLQPESLIITLINDLTNIFGNSSGGSEKQIIIVLDDYHMIDIQAIHEMVSFFLDHLPPQIHMIITTRSDPPLPLSRLRGRGQLIELREAELRFTLEEAAIFFSEIMGLTLTTDEVQALEDRIEGWVTGFQLAGLSMQKRENVQSFINTFTGSHRFIVDYLADEVLNRQSEEIKQFLLETSILNRLSGPVCDAVTRREDSRLMLETLDAANMFIVPLDDERRWYRYHHLFGEVLRNRLDQAYPDQIPVLHRRASAWYEQQGSEDKADIELINEAINHAMAGVDFDRAGRLISQTADITIWKLGQLDTLFRWLDWLPEQTILTLPQLCLTQALLLVWRNKFEAAETLLHDIIKATESLSPEKRDDIIGQAATIRAAMANIKGDHLEAMGLARQALEFLAEDNLRARGISMGILGGIYQANGDVAAGERIYTQAAAMLQATEQRVPALIALGYLGQMQTRGGRLRQAYQTLRQALHLAETWQAEKLPTLGVVYISMGELLREQNELGKARHYLEDGIALCRQWEGLADDILYGYLSLAGIHRARGANDMAHDILAQAEQLGRQKNVPQWEIHVKSSRARLWLSEGNIVEAEHWTRERQLGIVDQLSYPQQIEHMVLARLLTIQGKPVEAIALLANIRQTAEAAGRIGQVIEALVLQAVTVYQQGETAQALIHLGEALTLAEPEGFVRRFVDEGPVMAALLQQAAMRDIAQAYSRKLLSEFTQPIEVESGLAQPAGSAIAQLIEPLTAREREVLRLIAAGYSNPEIATELIIAITTVKTHVSNIYGKLNVDNRFQAINRAKTLNLV